MTKKSVKIAITGAAGQIGYALVFRIASGAMLGPNTEIELQLIELESAMPALKGVVMELEDCAFPLLRNVTITSDLQTGMQDANWVLLVGAVPRKQGQERSSLLRINGGIFAEQGRAINDYAANDVRVLVVGNPCNTNCFIAMHSAPDIPNDRFYAMLMLDQNRATAQLASKAGVRVSEVTQMTVWGNHSSTQYPDFYHAKISGKPAVDVIQDINWLKTTFLTTVQKRGAAVIQARGSSSAASAANAIIDSVYHLVYDTPINQTYSMGVASRGQYGVDEGLIYSFPCKTVEGQIHVVEDEVHNEFGQALLKKTLEEMRSEKNAVLDFLPNGC